MLLELNYILVIWVGIITSILGGVFSILITRQNISRRNLSVVQNKVNLLEIQLDKINKSIMPPSMAFQKELVTELTHYHTPEMDDLLIKLGPPFILTDEEGIRLEVLLKEREKDISLEVSDSERDAAHMLPMVIKRVKVDKDNLNKLDILAVPKEIISVIKD